MRTALLLIHGFLTCTDDWDVLLPHYSALYDEVVLFKQPGHERADEKPHFRDFSADSAYAALDETINSLSGFDAVDVVGHSMGGGMALYAASRLANVRRALVFAPAFRYPRPGTFARQGAMFRDYRAFTAEVKDEGFARVLREKEDCSHKALSGSVDLFFKRLLPHWSVRNIINFMRIMARARKTTESVKCPLCVMYGELDEFLPFSSAREVLEKTSSREKYFIRYGLKGHALTYLGDCSDVIADSVEFLSGGNPLSRTPEKAELRAAYRLLRGAATDKIVTATFDEQTFSSGGSDAVVRRRRVTETYLDGGAGFFAHLEKFVFIKTRKRPPAKEGG